MKKVTVFTPTYNRGTLIERLYKSLLRQTCLDFIWLIVDDGSTDNTRQMVEAWQRENKIAINYVWQENKGKMQAHNKGVELCETELFVCVDSDDYMEDAAIEKLINIWNCRNEKGVAGIVGKKDKLGRGWLEIA